MKCPKCGDDNPDYAVYCGRCASELPKAPVRKSTSCLNCGKQNPEGQKYCGDCGALLGEEGMGGSQATAPYEPPPLYFWMKLGWVVRFATLAVVGTGMGIILFILGQYDIGFFIACLGGVGWLGLLLLLRNR